MSHRTAVRRDGAGRHLDHQDRSSASPVGRSGDAAQAIENQFAKWSGPQGYRDSALQGRRRAAICGLRPRS